MPEFEASVPEDEDKPCAICGDPNVFVTCIYEGKSYNLCGECDEKATKEYIQRHLTAQTN